MTRDDMLISAVPTPFTEAGDLDLDALTSLLTELNDHVDAVLMAGTTGEFPALDDDERLQVFTTAHSILGSERTIAHIGHASVRQVINLGLAAADAGIERFAILTPYYLPTDAEGIIRWYAEISAALGDHELYGYLFPERTGVEVGPETARQIMELPGMAGLKLSGASSEKISDFAAVLGEGQKLYSGNDGRLLETLAAGGHGVVSGVSSAFPDVFGALRTAIAEERDDTGDLSESVSQVVRLVGPSLSRLLLALRLRTGRDWAGRMSGPAIDQETAALIRRLVHQWE